MQKDRKLVKVNAPVALQGSIRANGASKDTQNIKMTDNATTGRDNTDAATTSNGNMDNSVTGEVSTVYALLPPHYSGNAKHPIKIKSSSKHTTTIAEPSTGDLLLDSLDTVKASGHTVDLHICDVHIYEFLIQGTSNQCDLQGIEEDQLPEIQRNIQDKLKQRDEERERNITKRIKQYEEKYDFINKALLESIGNSRNDQD